MADSHITCGITWFCSKARSTWEEVRNDKGGREREFIFRLGRGERVKGRERKLCGGEGVNREGGAVGAEILRGEGGKGRKGQGGRGFLLGKGVEREEEEVMWRGMV